MLKYQLSWLRSGLFSKTARPGSSPCPAVNHDTGLHQKRFSRNVKQSRTEQTEGCVYSRSHARQGSGLLKRKRAAASQRIPVHPRTSPYIGPCEVCLCPRWTCPRRETPAIPPRGMPVPPEVSPRQVTV